MRDDGKGAVKASEELSTIFLRGMVQIDSGPHKGRILGRGYYAFYRSGEIVGPCDTRAALMNVPLVEKG